MSEGEPKFEEKKPKEIKDAINFEELYEILQQKREIEGEEGHKYSFKDLMDMIENLRDKILDLTIVSGIEVLGQMRGLRPELDNIPNKELRNKVSELLYKRFEDISDSQYRAEQKYRKNIGNEGN